MAVMGYLGKSAGEGIIFQLSDQRAAPITSFTWSGSSRYSVHQRHNTHALTEYTGMDPDKIAMDITLLAQLGVEPMKELVKLWRYLREGTPLQLVLGEHGYGYYRWTITALKIKARYFDIHGDVYCAEVSLSLQEYLSKDF